MFFMCLLIRKILLEPHSTIYKNKSWIEETLEKYESFLKCCPDPKSRKLD